MSELNRDIYVGGEIDDNTYNRDTWLRFTE